MECLINKLKQYRRIFSRFDKLDQRYLGFLYLGWRAHLVTLKCQHYLAIAVSFTLLETKTHEKAARAISKLK